MVRPLTLGRHDERSDMVGYGNRLVKLLPALGLAVLVLAACGSSGGPTGDGVPTGIGGPSAGAHSSAHHKAKPGKGKKSAKGGAKSSSSAHRHSTAPGSGGHMSTHSSGGGGGGGGSTGGGSGGRGGGGGGGTHSSSHPPAATCGPPPPSTTPLATVCPTTTGLQDGQTVTVYADGFQSAPPVLIFGRKLVVAECVNKSQSTNQGDCAPINYNTQMFKPTNGAIGPVTFTVHKTFGKGKNFHDCTKEDCLLAVSQPELKPKYEADVHLHFA